MKFLVIGDIHIKEDNVNEINILLKNIEVIFANQEYVSIQDEYSNIQTFPEPFDHIVLLGDILHHHEKIFSQSLNRALNFINRCTELCHTYILVGNHDYCLGENVEVLLWHGGVKMSKYS